MNCLDGLAHIIQINGNGFVRYIEPLGYAGIYLWYITIDQVTFIPEEVTLMTIGYLASNHIFNPFLAGLFAIAGFITIDLVYFLLTRRGSKLVSKLYKRLGESHNRILDTLKTNFPKAMLIICFIPRLRLFAPIVASMLAIKLKRFVLFDALSLLLFTTVYISIGYFAHKGLHAAFAELHTLRHIIFGASMLLFGLITFLITRKRNTKNA